MAEIKFSIFKYFNYVEMLNDYYDYRKKMGSYSHRQFLKDAEIKGSSFLAKVLSGTQKIQIKFIDNISMALSLNKTEKTYFNEMVHFCNSKDNGEKGQHLSEMFKIRYKFSNLRLIDKKLNYLKKWYYPVIRELAPLINFNEDYHILGRITHPRLNGDQAKGAVNFLVENGYLKKTSDNTYVQTEPLLATNAEVASTFVANYHKQNLQISHDDIDRLALSERDISSVTLSVSNENYTLIRDEIRAFRKKIVAIAEKTQKYDKVCHVGFQLTPRSRQIEDGNNE